MSEGTTCLELLADRAKLGPDGGHVDAKGEELREHLVSEARIEASSLAEGLLFPNRSPREGPGE
jgi:hypothetical protein